MTSNNILVEYFKEIADSIREVTDTTDLISPQDFSSIIKQLGLMPETPTSPNLVCVYDVTDISGMTELIDNRGYPECSQVCSSMIVDGVEMDLNYDYQFDSVGLHTVEFVLDEEYNTTIPGKFFGDIGNLNIVSITIPESITSIGNSYDNPFAYATSANLREFKGKYASKDGRCLIIDGECVAFAGSGLTSYTIPDNVTSIRMYTFAGCSSLTSVTIPDSVTSIGQFAFNNCENLTNITIPDKVTSIDWSTFGDCYKLKSATIGSSITSFGGYVFNGCSNLTSVYCKPIVPFELRSDDFIGISSNCQFYVPMESVNAYKSADDWKKYANAIVGYNF